MFLILPCPHRPAGRSMALAVANSPTLNRWRSIPKNSTVGKLLPTPSSLSVPPMVMPASMILLTITKPPAKMSVVFNLEVPFREKSPGKTVIS